MKIENMGLALGAIKRFEADNDLLCGLQDPDRYGLDHFQIIIGVGGKQYQFVPWDVEIGAGKMDHVLSNNEINLIKEHLLCSIITDWNNSKQAVEAL